MFSYTFVSSKLDSVLNKLNLPEINTDIVDVVVLADDKASSLNDLANYKFAYNSTASNANVKTAFDSVKSELNKSSLNLQNTNHGMTL